MTMHLCIHGDAFTRTQRIVDWLASHTRWPVVTDRDLIDAAARRFDCSAGRLEHLIKTPHGALNRLTHGSQRSMAYVRSVMAEMLGPSPTIFHGTLGLMSARRIPRVMNVLVAADKDFRVERARRTTAGNKRQVRRIIERMDRREFQWCRPLLDDDRFDADAYDLVVPSHRLDREAAGRLILEQLMQAEMRAGEDAADPFADFKLASTVQVRLCENGYPVSVDADAGRVKLTVERPVLMMNRLARKLERQVRQVEGVRQVETTVGPGFFQADIYRRSRFEIPLEMAFRSFTRCRRHLRRRAAGRLPATESVRPRQQESARVVQLMSPPSS